LHLIDIFHSTDASLLLNRVDNCPDRLPFKIIRQTLTFQIADRSIIPFEFVKSPISTLYVSLRSLSGRPSRAPAYLCRQVLHTTRQSLSEAEATQSTNLHPLSRRLIRLFCIPHSLFRHKVRSMCCMTALEAAANRLAAQFAVPSAQIWAIKESVIDSGPDSSSVVRLPLPP
jgi:hypothetical protein